LDFVKPPSRANSDAYVFRSVFMDAH
jgi:hypothetical protein